MLTNQIIFDIVVEHFKAQKVRATRQPKSKLDGPLCVYRSPLGLKCAVGILFTDEEYNPAMDSDEYGGGVNALIENGLLPERLKPFKSILDALQVIHDIKAKNQKDELMSATVAIALKQTARNYGLDSSKVDW